MPGIRGTAFRLAVFTVFTIAVTTWLATVIGNIHLFSSPYRLRAEFTDATGLLGGDVVKAAGVTVGRVSDISIDDGIAVVTMEISDGVELPRDLAAEIRFRNLIGQRMVVLRANGVTAGIENLSAQPPELIQDGALIPLERTSPAFDLTALFNGLRPLIQSASPADINTVTRSLTDALSGRRKEIESFLGNVADLSDTIASRDQELGALLHNVNIVTDDLAGRNDQLRRTLGNINIFLSEVAATKDDLDRALVTLDVATNRLERIVARSGDALDAELADLAVILDAVDDKRADLRAVVRALPETLAGVERVSGYGQWTGVHLINLCKDDLGTCGTRWAP